MREVKRGKEEEEGTREEEDERVRKGVRTQVIIRAEQCGKQGSRRSQ